MHSCKYFYKILTCMLKLTFYVVKSRCLLCNSSFDNMKFSLLLTAFQNTAFFKNICIDQVLWNELSCSDNLSPCEKQFIFLFFSTLFSKYHLLYTLGADLWSPVSTLQLKFFAVATDFWYLSCYVFFCFFLR